jgi:hypothetical protein
MRFKEIQRELRFSWPMIAAGLTLSGCGLMSAVASSSSAPVHGTTVTIDAPLEEIYEDADVLKGIPARRSVLGPVQVLIPNQPYQRPKGMKTGGTGVWFRGVQGDDPYTSDADLAEKLSVLWGHKMRIKGVTPATRKNADYIIKDFATGAKTRQDIKAFVKNATRVVNRMHDALDYKAYCAKMSMDHEQCRTLEDITDDLRGKDMVAYGMTELLPSQNGIRNIELLDNILRNAGPEFLNNVPAFGDPLLSKGLYQFTSYAVRWDASGPQGASIVNQFVDKKHQIPQSVVRLTMDDQHAAAFLFTTYNVSRWIRRMNGQQMKTFRKLMPSHQAELIQYIAVSHHMPGRTIQYANAWLNGGGRNEFLTYLPPHLRAYGTKTKNNYAAVKFYS